jgi:hypothetical protein
VKAIRVLVPLVLVIAYGLVYASGWFYVWRVHQTDPGDGLEYLVVLLSTLPWNVLGAPVAARLPAGGLPVFLTGCALVNAALIWWVSRRLLTQRRASGPGRA